MHPRITSDGIPGRTRDELLAVSQAEVVEANWRTARVLERLSHREANRLLSDVLEEEIEHAGKTMPVLEPWGKIPESSYQTYVGTANMVRVRRVLDFVQREDRVLDIGTGFGYVPGILLRDSGLSYYCGVDLAHHFLDSVADMAEVNGLSGDGLHLELLNLYDLTPTFVGKHRPDLVLLLEVLEHVPDTALAFQTLAAAIGPDTAVLFTVPMLGRLEGVWGHLSLFNQERLTRLCAEAGLRIHYVEPLHNTWLLVLVSRARVVLSRTAALVSKSRGDSGARKLRGYAFREIQLDIETGGNVRAVPTEGSGSHVATVSGNEGGLNCEVTSLSVVPEELASRDADGAGIEIQTAEPTLLRLEISYRQPENIERVIIGGLDARHRLQVQWEWKVTDVSKVKGRPITHVLKPGESFGHFTATFGKATRRVAHVSVRILLKAGTSASFTLLRAASVPPDA